MRCVLRIYFVENTLFFSPMKNAQFQVTIGAMIIYGSWLQAAFPLIAIRADATQLKKQRNEIEKTHSSCAAKMRNVLPTLDLPYRENTELSLTNYFSFVPTEKQKVSTVNKQHTCFKSRSTEITQGKNKHLSAFLVRL